MSRTRLASSNIPYTVYSILCAAIRNRRWSSPQIRVKFSAHSEWNHSINKYSTHACVWTCHRLKICSMFTSCRLISQRFLRPCSKAYKSNNTSNPFDLSCFLMIAQYESWLMLNKHNHMISRTTSQRTVLCSCTSTIPSHIADLWVIVPHTNRPHGICIPSMEYPTATPLQHR